MGRGYRGAMNSVYSTLPSCPYTCHDLTGRAGRGGPSFPKDSFTHTYGRHLDVTGYRLDFEAVMQLEADVAEELAEAAAARERRAAAGWAGEGGEGEGSDGEGQEEGEGVGMALQKFGGLGLGLVVGGGGAGGGSSSGLSLAARGGGAVAASRHEVSARTAAEYLALKRSYKGLEMPATGGYGGGGLVGWYRQVMEQVWGGAGAKNVRGWRALRRVGPVVCTCGAAAGRVAGKGRGSLVRTFWERLHDGWCRWERNYMTRGWTRGSSLVLGRSQTPFVLVVLFAVAQ